jgi:hypothetical protein
MGALIRRILYGDIPSQKWAKGPMARSSVTDSIFRLYRPIQSVDFKFPILYLLIVSVLFRFF